MKPLSHTMAALSFAAATLHMLPAEAGRDPFARPALPAAALADAQAPAADEPAARPQLRAVMITSGQALANIGGRILAEGEWFGNYRVLKIRERSVTLASRSGAKTELALDQADNK